MNEENNIVILALCSGEHLIADVNSDSVANAYVCTSPMQIMGQPDDNGQMKMGISPYMPYADTSLGVCIPMNMAILAIPQPALMNAYQSACGKIITPPQPKIILS